MNNLRQAKIPAALELSSFALLRLEQTRLLIPQKEIRVLELAMDMIRENPPIGGVGWINFKQQQCPVYLPSPHLEWMTSVTGDRPLCALMETGDRLFALLCSEVIIVRANELRIHPIPPALAKPDAPFHQFAMHQGNLCCLSSATTLLACLPLGSAP